MRVPELQYEPTAEARPVYVERDGGVTRIVVKMQGLYVPIPRWVWQLEALSVVVAPIWWVVGFIIRSCLRCPKPPRAVFEVSDVRFRMTLRDPATGETTVADWPRSDVAEARANRYERGLWLNVTGQMKDTVLQDLPRESIERLEAELTSALTPMS
jgi:hypothetical protein